MNQTARDARTYERLLRSIIAWTVFPLTLGASLLLAYMWLLDGYGHGALVLIISGVVAAFLFVLERFQPYAEQWRGPRDDVGTDLAHMVFSTMLVPSFVESMFRGVLLFAAAALAATAGYRPWPTDWPMIGQLALALLVGEFGPYWWHRACHENSWLWRIHATHHSSTRLYWLNSCRFHPIDSCAQYALEVLPLIVLGCGPDVLALFILATAVIGMFQHTNVALRLGLLNWIFSMTELHRWHHSRETREGNSNYGANLIVWDILFGTRYLPVQRQFDADHIGLANMPNFPQRYLGQLLSPFCWSTLTRASGPVADEMPSGWQHSLIPKEPHYLQSGGKQRETVDPGACQVGAGLLTDATSSPDQGGAYLSDDATRCGPTH